MAYYKIQNGERQLIYTARDRAKQAQRRALWRAFEDTPRRRLSDAAIKRQIESYWRLYSSDGLQVIRDNIEDLLQLERELRKRLALTLKWRRTGVHSPGVSATGDAGFVRRHLYDVQERLRFWRLCEQQYMY